MRKQRQGFTLVELLVVIGIIALLISVLMPALNTARSAARLVQCQSNQKQIYNAILFYTTANKGFLPYASPAPNGGNWGASGTNAETYFDLSTMMGYTNTDNMNWDAEIAPVFRCTEALNPDDGIVWNPRVIRTIRLNPRAFPGYDQMADAASRAEWPQRKLSTIKNTADKIALWEGPQLLDWNLCTEPESIHMEGWRASGAGWGHKFCDPSLEGWDNINVKLQEGPNIDHNGWFQCVARFRHNNNRAMSVLFFDGHAEVRRVGELWVRDFCINRHQ